MLKKSLIFTASFLIFLFHGTAVDSEQSGSPNRADAVRIINTEWAKGIDIYEKNIDFPSWQDMYNAGYRFVFHKASQYRADKAFNSPPEYRWLEMRNAGFIRGAYHFYRHDAGTVQEQAQRYIDVVQRLIPGDLGPVMDIEDEAPEHNASYWIFVAHAYLDAVETALGRTPIIYTSARYWKEFVDDSGEFSEYPLWVVHNTTDDAPALPAGWNDWLFWQWHTENSQTPMPYPFKQKDNGVDLNWFKGSIWQLRGFADLGKIAHYYSGTKRYKAYTDIGGHILVSSFANIRRTWDIHQQIPNAPLSAGDPALGISNNHVFIAYRARHNNHICLLYPGDIDSETTSPVLMDLTETIGGYSAAGDPAVLVHYPETSIVYWGNNNHTYRLWWDGAWHVADVTAESGSPATAGNPVAYITGDTVHTISRTGRNGHMHDIWFEEKAWHTRDIIKDSHDTNGNPAPPSTYTPTTYQSYYISAKYQRIKEPVRLVYRAVRGQIWEIERKTLYAINLSDAAGNAPAATGSPDAYFMDGMPHIIYRDNSGRIHELYNTSSTWRHRIINLSARAAADPQVSIVDNTVYLTFFDAQEQRIREWKIGGRD